MERLTSRNEKGDLLVLGEYVYAGNMYEAADTLEQYEDTGLTPESVATMKAEYVNLANECIKYKAGFETAQTIMDSLGYEISVNEAAAALKGEE